MAIFLNSRMEIMSLLSKIGQGNLNIANKNNFIYKIPCNMYRNSKPYLLLILMSMSFGVTGCSDYRASSMFSGRNSFLDNAESHLNQDQKKQLVKQQSQSFEERVKQQNMAMQRRTTYLERGLEKANEMQELGKGSLELYKKNSKANFDDYNQTLVDYRDGANKTIKDKIGKWKQKSDTLHEQGAKILKKASDMNSLLNDFNNLVLVENKAFYNEYKTISYVQDKEMKKSDTLFTNHLVRQKNATDAFVLNRQSLEKQALSERQNAFNQDIEEQTQIFEQKEDHAKRFLQFKLKKEHDEHALYLSTKKKDYDEKYREKKLAEELEAEIEFNKNMNDLNYKTAKQKEEERKNKEKNQEAVRFLADKNKEQERNQTSLMINEALEKDYEYQWKRYNDTLNHVRSHSWYNITRNEPPKIVGKKVIPGVLKYRCR